MSPAPPPDSMTGGGQGRIDEQGRIDDITDAARDFALQLPWALLLVLTLECVEDFEEVFKSFSNC